uniref:CRAL-TRIO domain-containing protein n=1 Tax=Dendroctonus ponderosae TaxID=77166 RepID=A0AAR5PGE2_DENPD
MQIAKLLLIYIVSCIQISCAFSICLFQVFKQVSEMEQIESTVVQNLHAIEELNENDVELSPQINLKEPDLDDPILKWAERNIAEDPNNKIELIEELKDMIFERGECEPHRMDDAFLLRFLRARHFIVRMAHRLMVNYYTFRETNPTYFSNIDYSKLLELGEAEIFTVPPYVDQNGRRLLYFRIENWNTSQFTTDELFQAIIFLINAAILEPKHQILGGICIIDVNNLGAGHAWYLTPKIAKSMVAVGYSSLPHRIEAVHIVNGSKLFDYAFGLLKPLLPEYVRQKIIIHSDLDSLHKWVLPKYLPKRYGGIHKDYRYNEWLSTVSNNEDLLEEIESYGYTGGKDFLKSL